MRLRAIEQALDLKARWWAERSGQFEGGCMADGAPSAWMHRFLVDGELS
jgi:hypothetical protein